jgi:carboxymethylenebutenolidase
MRRFWILAFTSLLIPTFLAASDTAQDDYVERMEREHATDSPVASPAAQLEPRGEVTSAEVVYADIDGTAVKGFLAKPASGEPTAGILVIHEWWGLNDNIRSMARLLAGEGYAALAVDIYEGEVADNREDAARLARASGESPDRGGENLRQAWEYLKDEVGVSKVGVIGWCFGGGWSLRAALMMGEGIDAAVIYYGRVVTDRDSLKPLSSPVLGIFGALDEGIPVSAVREFQATLDSLGKNASIHIYEGADHAFANPSGTRYNQDAAEDAWAKTLTFFGQLLR